MRQREETGSVAGVDVVEERCRNVLLQDVKDGTRSVPSYQPARSCSVEHAHFSTFPLPNPRHMSHPVRIPIIVGLSLLGAAQVAVTV